MYIVHYYLHLCMYIVQEVSGSAELLAYVSGSNEIITRKLDGSNPKVILSSNLLKISCIALHQDSVGFRNLR